MYGGKVSFSLLFLLRVLFFVLVLFTSIFFNILIPVQRHCQENFSLNK